MLSKLKKLRGRGFAELADRGRQKAGAWAERAGVLGSTRMPSDDELFGLFESERITSAEQLLDNFRAIVNDRFYPSFHDPAATISVIRERFPEEEKQIICRADRVCSGVFDLLGYEGLDFGRPIPDWHFDPVSGKRSPMTHRSLISETDADQTGDKKVIWELNRHQYFISLGQAYWLTGDEKYFDIFKSHIDDWIENNPPKMGLNWLSSLEIAFRSISWIWAINFFVRSPGLQPDLFLRILKSLYANGMHLENNLSTYSSPNTHLTGEALGLYFLGLFWGDTRDAARWKETGYRILREAVDFQIRGDGGYVEQSTQYQRYTADFFLSLLLLRRMEGLPDDEIIAGKVEKLLEFLQFCERPDGRTTLIGDDDGGRLHFLDGREFDDFRPTLSLGAAVFGDGKLKHLPQDSSPEVIWLLGAEALHTLDSVSIPVETSKAFDLSGFYFLRSGWKRDSNWLCIDSGEHGFLSGGHAHADALGVVFSVKGIPVLVDSGTYNYTTDSEARDRFRSTAAHNCMTVNGTSSSVSVGPFSWDGSARCRLLEWRSDNDETKFRGEHDGYLRFGVRYEREIEVNKDWKITVSDSISCDRPDSFEFHFILSKEVEAELESGSRAVIRSREKKEPLVTICTSVNGDAGEQRLRIEPWSISPRYGKLIDSSKLLLTVRGQGNFTVVSSIEIAA